MSSAAERRFRSAEMPGSSSGDRALWLAQPKSIPSSDELYDLPDIGISAKIRLQVLNTFLQRAAFTKEVVDRLLHSLDLVFREPAAFQPNKVEARKVSTIALNATKGNHIIDHCESADPDELVYRCEPTDNHTITHHHVPAEGRVVGHEA